MGIWLLRRLRRPFALATLFLLTLPVTAQGAPPALIRQDRGVFARVGVVESGGAEDLALADEAVDFAPYSASQLRSVSTAGSSASAQAIMASDLDGSVLSGSATTNVVATTTVVGARGEAPADAFLDVVFEPTEPSAYQLTGSVEVASSQGTANASVELMDETTGAMLSSHRVDVTGSEIINTLGALVEGRAYRLRASAVGHARVDTPATALAEASYGVTLTLPEPSAVAGLLAGIGLLGASRRCGR